MTAPAKLADVRALSLDVADLFRPPRRVAVSQTAAESMVVVQGNGTKTPWNPDETPYMVEPMDCMGMREFLEVIFVGPSRSGKTKALVDGYICHKVINDPGDGLLAQITEEKAREHSKKELDRMFNASPDILDRLSPRGHDNNVHDKIFRNGQYLAIKWPSKNVFASSDFQYVLMTDLDRVPRNVGGEGSPFLLARKRIQTFGSTGMALAESSPGFPVKDADWKQPKDYPHMAPPCDGVLGLYNDGDRRRLYWQCLESSCRHWFMPTFENFDLDSARVFCPKCGRVHHQKEKTALNANHRWLPEGCELDDEGLIHGKKIESRRASFWMEGPAASYQTWEELRDKLNSAERKFESTEDQEDLKVVTNTDWGRPYKTRISAKRRSSKRIRDRAEQIAHRTVPDGVRFLIATVDVQGGQNRRFVVQIHGFGVGREAWLVDRFNISEDRGPKNDQEPRQINPATRPEDWNLLTRDVLNRSYKLADRSGRRMPILALGVDTGGEGKGEESVTSQAYEWYREMVREGYADRCFLLKGDGIRTASRVRKSYPDNTGRKSRTSSARGDVPLYLVNTDAVKDMVVAMMDRIEHGPGYMHVPDWVGTWWYDELTAEVKDPKTGKYMREGKAANEAFDLWVYALVLYILVKAERIDWANPPAWARVWNENSMVFDPGEQAGEAIPIIRKKKKSVRRRRVVKRREP
ncbi:MAG: terminase gpA endonuclease subunit [Pseudomonadota bacterium]